MLNIYGVQGMNAPCPDIMVVKNENGASRHMMLPPQATVGGNIDRDPELARDRAGCIPGHQ